MTAKAGRVFDDLGHMLEALRRIDHYTQDAVIRNLEVIGEAARNVQRHDPAFAASHPDIPWAVAYRMRNALSHGYEIVAILDAWT